MTTESEICGCDEALELRSLLEAATAELDRRDEHLAALRGLLRRVRAWIECPVDLSMSDICDAIDAALAPQPPSEGEPRPVGIPCIIGGHYACFRTDPHTHAPEPPAVGGEPYKSRLGFCSFCECPECVEELARYTSTAPRAANERCSACGFVMCEQFNERRLNAVATLATPNGKFRCYHCTPVGATEARAPSLHAEGAAPAGMAADLRAVCLLDAAHAELIEARARVSALEAECDQYKRWHEAAVIERAEARAEAVALTRKLADLEEERLAACARVSVLEGEWDGIAVMYSTMLKAHTKLMDERDRYRVTLEEMVESRVENTEDGRFCRACHRYEKQAGGWHVQEGRWNPPCAIGRRALEPTSEPPTTPKGGR